MNLREKGSRAELVSVVVPARNEERFIASCLDSVLAQNYANLQVIVVNGNSKDKTAEIIKGYAKRDARIEEIFNPKASIPESLNLALQASRGPWLVRVDAHSVVPPDYVDRAVSHLRSGRWGGVGGRKEAVGTTPAGKAIAAAMGSRLGVGNSVYHHGTKPQTVDHIPFGAYPSDLLRRLGGWNEHLLANEDYELDWRIRQSGLDLLFDPDLRIAWHCRQSILELFRQYQRYGRGKASVARMHPASMRIRHFLPPAFLSALVAAGFLTLTGRRGLSILIGPYTIAIAAGAVATSRSSPQPAASGRVAAAFLAMHFGWGLGFWEGMARAVWNQGIFFLHRRQ